MKDETKVQESCHFYQLDVFYMHGLYHLIELHFDSQSAQLVRV